MQKINKKGSINMGKMKKMKSLLLACALTGTNCLTSFADSNFVQNTVDTAGTSKKGFQVVEFSKQTGKTPTSIKISGLTEESAEKEIKIYKDLSQRWNGNFPDDQEYGSIKPGKEDPTADYQMEKLDTVKDSIYFKFKGGFKGANIYIPKETYRKNPDLKVTITYPNSVYKTSIVKNETTGENETTHEIADARLTFDGFIYTKSRGIDFDGIMLSTSYNFFSGMRPKNISNYRLTLEMLDKEGNPLNVEEIKDADGKKYKGSTYFTVGSLNSYLMSNDVKSYMVGSNKKDNIPSGDYPIRQFSEGITMLNAPNDTNVYLTKDTNIESVKFKSQASDPNAEKYNPGSIIQGSKWNTYYNNLNLDFYRGVRNDFTDILAAHDFQKNAVSFELKQANSYKFLMGTVSDKIIVGQDDKTSNTAIDGTGWSFFMSTPLFEQLDDIIAPTKTVSDDDEKNVVENWHNSSTEPMTYNVNYRVPVLGGSTIKFYDSYKMQDSLPQEVEYVSGRILCDGKEFSKNVKYDKEKHQVYWVADKEDTGYQDEYTYTNASGNVIKEAISVPGRMKLDGETYSLEIKVKINKEALEKGTAFKNRGEVLFNKEKQASNEVITHPSKEDLPEIKKDVEGKDSKVAEIGEENEFNLKVKLPKDVVNYSKLDVKDILDSRFDYVSNSIKAETQTKDETKKYEDIKSSYDSQTRELKVVAKDTKALKDKEYLNISFKAKLNDSTEPNASVPNKGKVEYSSLQGVEGSDDSNIVHIVSSKVISPKITKDVEGSLNGVYKVGENFKYNINVELPKNIKSYEKLIIKDKLDNRIDLDMKSNAPNVILKAGDKEIKDASITYDAKTKELKAQITNISDLDGAEKLTLTINASINSSAQKGEKIPNKGTLEFTPPGGEVDTKDSNVVNVETNDNVNNPGEPVKDVEGKNHYETEVGKEFTYHINVDLPANAETYKKFAFKDTLDSKLDYVSNSAEVTLDGKKSESFKIDFDSSKNILTATIEKANIDSLKDGKKLTLTFKAKLNEKAADHKDVPNDASFSFVNNSDFTDENDSNKVTVNDNSEDEDISISKSVEGKDKFDTKKNDKFAYTLSIAIPKDIYNYKEFEVKDVLDKKIDYVGLKSLTVDGLNAVATSNKPNTDIDIVNDKNNPISYEEKTRTLSLKIPSDKIKNLKGKKEIKLVFDAQVIEDGSNIPNKATIIVKNDKDKVIDKDSNVVYVNTEDNTTDVSKDFELKKTINNSDSAEITKGDTFSYKLTTKLPSNIAEYKKLVVKDILDPKIVPVDDTITIKSNGNELAKSNYSLTAEGNNLSVEITNIKALKNDLEITFKAKLKDDVKVGDKVANKYVLEYNDPEGKDGDETSNEVNVSVKEPEKETPNNTATNTNNGSSNDGKGEAKIKTGDETSTKLIATIIIGVAAITGGTVFVIKKRRI